jgi:hypothetical protein
MQLVSSKQQKAENRKIIWNRKNKGNHQQAEAHQTGPAPSPAGHTISG